MDSLELQFGGRLGTTFADSKPWWQPNGPRDGNPPNVLQIIFDDTGWADFGCFGSEIDTPSLDALAAQGLRYTNFHVTPLCSPTRACLMTGRNHHRVGMRFLADIDTGFPNSRGRVDPSLPMVPAQLREAGYGTYLVGKWHLAPQHEITPAGPFGNWPLARGFDRFYGFLDGCTDQFSPELFEDNHFVVAKTGPDYHLTDDLADRAITMLSDHVLYRPHDPLYMTFAPGATHAPLQAPRALIDKYMPRFDKGWDRTRADRLARQIGLGIVPAGTALTERNPGVSPWESLDTDERRLFIRQQAAYAAFLEHADAAIGRIIARLELLGLRRNTVVLVMSDNGASREGGRFGAVDVNGPYSGSREPVADQLGRIDLIGGPDGPAHYPEGWAMAGNTPFRRYKQSVDLGGVRSPLIVNWPAGIPSEGEVRTQFAHAIDIAATVVDIAGGRSGVAMDGASLRDTFASAAVPAPRSTQYWEMFGHRAIWQDGWKAVTEHAAGDDYDSDRWRLYDVATDFAENNDLADTHPERLAGMIATWWREAHSNQVLPLDDRSLVELLNSTRTPHQLVNRRRLVLRPENTHVPVSLGVTSAHRAMRLTARLSGRARGESGIIVSTGARQGGYALYVLGDALVFEHIALSRRVRIAGEISGGSRSIGLELRRSGDQYHVMLFDGDRQIGAGAVPLAISHPSFWGLDVGSTPLGALAGGLTDCPRFRAGVLESVSIDFLEHMTSEDMADLLAQTE